MFSSINAMELLREVSYRAQARQQGLSWSPVLFGKDWVGKQTAGGRRYKDKVSREDESCYLQKKRKGNSHISMREPYKEENMRQGGSKP